jgi:small-conductance mechanosensitive channel
MIYRFIATGVIVVAWVVLRTAAGITISRRVKAQTLRPQNALVARKMVTLLLLLLLVLALGFTWGATPKTMWISVASIVVLIAIAFFGVWSLINNIVAGFILLLSRPFEIGDEIVILPDNIQCTVTDMTAVFLVLKETDGTVIIMPNNFVFQRIVKRIRKES